MSREPKAFKRACRRGQWARADYILRAWRSRCAERSARLWLESGGLR
jgi:hypothetical protein